MVGHPSTWPGQCTGLQNRQRTPAEPPSEVCAYPTGVTFGWPSAKKHGRYFETLTYNHIAIICQDLCHPAPTLVQPPPEGSTPASTMAFFFAQRSASEPSPSPREPELSRLSLRAGCSSRGPTRPRSVRLVGRVSLEKSPRTQDPSAVLEAILQNGRPDPLGPL